MVSRTLSPRELAEVIGVSQSSVKRWVDAGLIGVSRTAGGHRRILLADAVSFIRERNLDVLRPDLLGLPPRESESGQVIELTADRFYATLYEGQLDAARSMIVGAYLAGTSPAEIWDGAMAPALRRFGELYHHEQTGIFTEHRATALCQEVLAQLRLLMPEVADEAPVAIGAAPEHDPYVLPTLISDVVLTSGGYRTVNLGPNTPTQALEQAVEVYKPAVVWCAMVSPVSSVRLAELTATLSTVAQRAEVVAVGGRAAEAIDWPAPILRCGSMRDLEAALR